MRAVGVEELHHLPFVRHQLDPDRVEGAWLDGDAAAVLVRRPMVDGTIRTLSGFGPVTGLHRLLEAVAAEVEPPARVMVDAPDATAVPATWPLTEVRHWHWMRSTRALPPETVAVEELPDLDEVAALLDTAAPDSHARPGTPGVEAWLGVRDDRGGLVAVGAVVRQPDGTGHLRAVTVAGHARGRGLGRELSTAMTRRAMADTGVSSLGVYLDNEPALRIYRGLGYEVAHSFSSGPVSASSITTAVAPSR